MEKINAATGETLRKEYESGLMSREIYNEVKGMMRYYVPLRGWEETTAEQVFDYNRKDSPIQNNQKKTKGRKSIADNPIATIAAMAQSAIVRGNRNRMKQRFSISSSTAPILWPLSLTPGSQDNLTAP